MSPRTDDPVVLAARELRAAAKLAAATIEPLLRWSMLLESDSSAATRAMRKVLASKSTSNTILFEAAKRALDALEPEAVDEAAAKRRETEDRERRYALRNELETELVERLGIGGDDREASSKRLRLLEQITELLFPSSARRRRTHEANVVAVTFGRPGIERIDGGHPPGAA